MRLLIQRVNSAKVTVDGQISGAIGKGLLVFLGIHKDDTLSDTVWLVNKFLNLRIFSDREGKTNLSIKDVVGKVLVVSQFTLYANCLRGRRPDFIDTAPPREAEMIYHKFVDEVEKELGEVQTGIFGEYMEVSLVNDGPMTILLETPESK